jgi:hypothetical protein
MSWSFQGVGKPSKIPAAIDKAIEGYGATDPNNQSRKEFELAAVALKSLVAMNSDDNAVSVEANGHANFDTNGKMTYGQCQVTIKSFYGFIG